MVINLYVGKKKKEKGDSMKAKIIRVKKHWEIHIYNTLDELIDRIHVTALELSIKEKAEE